MVNVAMVLSNRAVGPFRIYGNALQFLKLESSRQHLVILSKHL